MGKPKPVPPKAGLKLPAPTTAPPVGSTDNEPPAFCFKHLVPNFTMDDLTDTQKVALVDKLHKLSCRSWSTIKGESRYKNGTETIAQSSLRKPLPAAVTADIKIVSFHLPDLFRMIGWRQDRLFHVIWLDGSGECYDHD